MKEDGFQVRKNLTLALAIASEVAMVIDMELTLN